MIDYDGHALDGRVGTIIEVWRDEDLFRGPMYAVYVDIESGPGISFGAAQLRVVAAPSRLRRMWHGGPPIDIEPAASRPVLAPPWRERARLPVPPARPGRVAGVPAAGARGDRAARARSAA